MRSAAGRSTVHRYLIERSFPAGALDSLDAATKEKVNANNATVGEAPAKTRCARPQRSTGFPSTA